MKDTLWHIDWGDGDTNFVIASSKKKAIAKMRDGKDMANFVVKLDYLYNFIFKAGEEKARGNILAKLRQPRTDTILRAYFDGGKQQGIKEVVEWVEDWNFWDNLSDDIRREWQAQKKKWGLK